MLPDEVTMEEARSVRGRALGPDALALQLRINGEVRSVRADPATTLVEVLRDDLGLTGTKIGCDRGACSACTRVG